MKIKWTLNLLQAEALKYHTRGEFRKKSNNAYQTARNRSMLDIICSHMTPLRKKWTQSELYQEALKYNTRNEFYKTSSGAYQTANKKGILNNICEHMTYDYKWTDEELRQEAFKYNTRNEFKKSNPNAYQTTLKRKLLDTFCQHMLRSNCVSKSEQDLINKIKQLYPKSKKLIDRKVKIPNKLHIKGFDLDIYIPELRRGIEFDGIYWHSVEGLRRSRKHWPEQDLIDYHHLKDEYFRSQDIEIYHVKEYDWLKDQKQCIKSVLDFLGGFLGC